VIWNLCLNAVEAMPLQGTLTVRTAVRPSPNQLFRLYGSEPQAGTQELTIEVEDTGPGIPPDVQEKIFEPFFSTKDGGTGLGLATVHRIIGTHKGRIEVESQLGHGTTMRICLPLPWPQPESIPACSPQ
jgi:signal transduction histidine kinase